ncbi:MAG: glycerol-3-phosphate 1-O-acyltransferase PlsY [Magnetococcales bacterium]|nr:glycerol-3-phosphate 1-O-acyltransferase PlsY [Magnetococcales bacterium]NGZ25965.1 glycerol-3-phosphate 1-O-acyltransferase PlsY [Magnetococcales bacterium]
MEDPVGIILAALSYLLGAVPFGLLIAKLAGAGDIRQQGSGNIGATNVLRTAGKIPGAIALFLDMAKGALPVAVALYYVPKETPMFALVAIAPFIGHLFPVYLGFRGGKGVATALGVWLIWTPWIGLAMLGIWLAAAKIGRISSLAALAAFALLPVMLYLTGQGTIPLLTALVMVILIFWKHQQNIRRLLDGTEPRIGRKE